MICERDAALADADPSNDIGRTVMTLPGTGCFDAKPDIWTFKLRLANKVEVIVSTAVFDPSPP